MEGRRSNKSGSQVGTSEESHVRALCSLSRTLHDIRSKIQCAHHFYQRPCTPINTLRVYKPKHHVDHLPCDVSPPCHTLLQSGQATEQT
eukprot:4328533-Amphidinium_carterae.1